MSEEVEVQLESSAEKHNGVSVDDVLSAIQQKNIGQAKAHFSDLMGIKIDNALESEKVKIANQVFNGKAEEEVPELEPESEESETDMESEIESAFDEDEV
jgi:hypothetical protein